ncbi:hypothetical protein SAMN05444161_8517 [Rhizobiales bacterium GAS191]|nr:hypothetical protein SAMN05444161_8517 [Rhizobiales bacterium GAS191]
MAKKSTKPAGKKNAKIAPKKVIKKSLPAPKAKTTMLATNNYVHPPKWYFPTPDPNEVMVCDWNPISKRYNLHCEVIQRPAVPSHIMTAIRKSSKIGKES